ncbi:MAG: deoxyguanosinetriphosphate triphosphohydrolase [Dehalococcoidia bacterium]|nr:deoxyguanosinetriphosphate triphosphohydrolase [Dehalococcoidia bacterium]
MLVDSLGVRQRLEGKEAGLSPHAARSALSRGRARPEVPCPLRTEFQRDRDRIIHSKAFRRLKHKTQVFIAPAGDHYVTRLTHVLEVAQIARTISRALNLNEDLTEAIALGHDLGHTPFGHIGEEVLDRLYSGGFKHYEQSLRVVDILENDGRGLNLTWEVRDGILNHSKGQTGILGEGWSNLGTVEGEVCKLADIVAYVNHDTADAIRAGMITEADLPPAVVEVLGRSNSARINTMVSDIVASSWAVTGPGDPGRPAIKMSARVLEVTGILRDFLFERVYRKTTRMGDARQARRVLRLLYDYFCRHESELPVELARASDSVERRVVDYIAGMTDQYALGMARRLGGSGTKGQQVCHQL